MAASDTKESMMLCCTVTVNGESLCSYEDVRNFVKTIDPRFYDTFGQLFPTSLAFDKYDYIAKFFSVDEREKAFDFYRSQYNLDVFGAMMCSVLRYCTNNSPPRSISNNSPSDDEISDVYSLSIEALITKVESDPSDLIDHSTVLREAFSLPYIDPHDYVGKIVKRLMKNMNEHNSNSGSYVAPYTSLVTSSMMGKSRLMKELAQHVPLVYICLRQTADEGQFPPATMYLRNWIKEGACASVGATKVTDLDIASDNHNIIATLRYSLFLLHMIFKLGVLIDEFSLPAKHLEIKAALPTSSYVKSYAWLWDFFADPRPVFATPCQQFWEAVQADTVTEFRNLRRASAKGNKSPTTCTWASTYLTTTYPGRVTEAHHNLQNSFRRLMCRRDGRQPATLIVCFDEARFLCDTSALTNVEIRSRHNRKSLESTDTGMSNVLYSNFRALRRALRFLKQGQLFIPRVFGLFTDTTSRLTNFQPRETEESTEESTGGRVLELPSAGANQFDPIYIFTSIDAHSRIIENNPAISDHRQVAKVERLLKFGRAGWYSIYSATPNSATSESMSMNPTYNKKSLLDIATGKLLGGLRQPADSINQLETNHEDATSKWLALLACRLALSVGPFSREAEELVSNHLAVLLRADKDRLKIYYPSEPILGEASASITNRTGWKPALKALHNHLQNGVINAGYRGELLSKVLCLIAMDSITITLPASPSYWEHTQPVKVRDFLDGWLASPNDELYDTFSDALLATHHRTDKKELKRFLDGYVFFNHFVRLDRILSLEAIVGAWNRGAAITPKENTHSFDHVIPVMLAPRGRKKTAPEFGPLHKSWNEDQLKSACSHVSFILINSRNYAAAVSHNTAAYGCTPNQRNFKDFDMFGGKKKVEFACGGETPKTVFLSIAQGFGPRQQKEPYVNIRPRGTRTTTHRVYRQIVVILKELGPKTYACVKKQSDFPDDASGGRMEIDPEESMEREESMEEEDEVEDDVPDSALPYDDGEEDEEETPDYGSLQDEEEGSEMADVTDYLRMLKTANLGFLDEVDEEDLPGVKGLLPVVYAGDDSEAAKQEEKEWDEASKYYLPLLREMAGDRS